MTAARLCSGRAGVLNWPACSPGPSENIWGILKRKKPAKNTQDCSAVRILWDKTPATQQMKNMNEYFS